MVAGVCASTVLRRKRVLHISQQLKRVTGQSSDADRETLGNRFAAAIGQKTVRRQSDLQSLSKLMRGAGFYSPTAPYVLSAVQVATATVALVCVLLWTVGANLPMRMVVLYSIAAIALGYLLPRFAVRYIAKGHQRRIRCELPLFIDMLLLLVRSGLGLERCFREIECFGTDAVPVMQSAIRLLLIDLDQGRGYEEALMRWAERMSEPAALEVARQLQQSLIHGTEVAKALSTFAQRFTDQRLVSARETAGRRSSMVTLVTVGLFLPPLIVILAGPGFSQLSRLFHGF